MRVYNYLELNLVQNEKALSKFAQNFGFTIGEHKLIDLYQISRFYSQQFKPELITELFEGWSKYQDDVYFDMINDTKITLDQNKVSGKQWIKYENNCWYHLPETLNDFIRDCQRAGIELTWKVKV